MANADLTGKVALVTGAARGLGAEMALQLSQAGATLALVGLEPVELNRVAARCHGEAAAWEADVTNSAQLEAVVAEVVAHFGQIDICVVNAGIATSGPVVLADPVSFDRVIEVNLLGSVRTTRAVLPHLIASRGYLLQMASLAALTPSPSMAAYCSSKSGVEAFAHCLRSEVAHHGVDVGVAYLSFTDTDMVRGADAVPQVRNGRKSMPPPFNRTYPLKPTVTRLVEGIAARKPHVYGQNWVRFIQPVRAFLPALLTRVTSRRMADIELSLRSVDPDTWRPVGAGGAADTKSRLG